MVRSAIWANPSFERTVRRPSPLRYHQRCRSRSLWGNRGIGDLSCSVSEQDSGLSAAGARPCEEKGSFLLIAGQRGRGLEFRARLLQPARSEKKVASGRW